MNATGSLDRSYTARTAPLPALHLVRLCGEFGPVLFCCGELSVATEESLRRELAFLEPLGHPVLTLDLTCCDLLDTDAALTLLDHCTRWQEHGRRLVVIAGSGQPAYLLGVTGIGQTIPAFPSAEQAARALREGARWSGAGGG